MFTSPSCLATPEAHCCWLDGEVCHYFDPDALPRGCTLRSELGSWDAVTSDPRWIADVKPWFDAHRPGGNCNDWPWDKCDTCGVVNG